MSSSKVGQGKVVSITYAILDPGRVVLEQSDIPVAYVHGGPNKMFEPVEEALEGCGVGDKVEVTLAPGEAFGEHNPDLTFTDDVENVPPQFRHVGAEVQMQNERGEVRTFFVTRIEDGKLTVDCNHPFAGKTLIFAVTVADIRPASDEEMRLGVSESPVLH
jgi:FKBP-type peptidyl-prolyl cis-trans isomerase SlyD